MKTFYQLLVSALVVSTTNNFVWFAIVFWAYLGTRSVISTAFVGGIYLVATALSGFWFGSLVDHHKKKLVMLGSNIATLILFTLGFLIYTITPQEAFTSVTSPILWAFIFLLMCGVVAGNIFGVAIPTLITVLVPENKRDKANGLFGTIMGISFAITSFASGIVLAYGGMFWVLIIAIMLTLLATIYLGFVSVPEKK